MMLKPICYETKTVCIGAMSKLETVCKMPKDEVDLSSGNSASVFMIPDRSSEISDFEICLSLEQDFEQLLKVFGSESVRPKGVLKDRRLIVSKLYILVHKLEALSQMAFLAQYLLNKGFRTSDELHILVFQNGAETPELEYMIEAQCLLKDIPLNLVQLINPKELFAVIFQI